MQDFIARRKSSETPVDDGDKSGGDEEPKENDEPKEDEEPKEDGEKGEEKNKTGKKLLNR